MFTLFCLTPISAFLLCQLIVDKLNIKDDDKADSDDEDLDVESGDIREDDELEDDLSDEEEGEDVFEPQLTLGDKLLIAWDKRSKKLEHDMAITGWMVSLLEECREDAQKNHEGFHRDAVERLIRKMFGPEAEESRWDMGGVLNCFWEEFEHFHNKTGPFKDRDHIWNSADINNGDVSNTLAFYYNPANDTYSSFLLLNPQSHIWHSKNSLRYTKIFGRLACRVCSKIL